MDVKKELVELILDANIGKNLSWYDLHDLTNKKGGCAEYFADYLISNGATIQEWIPVSERLPELNTDVLVCARYGYFGIWSLVRDEDEDSFYWEDDSGWFKSLDDITHWMALPEPPKEE